MNAASIDPLFWREHPEYDSCRKEFGTYSIPFVALPISAQTKQRAFKVDRDHDFIMTALAAPQTTSITNAAYILTPMQLQLSNDATSQLVNNVFLEVLAMAGGSANSAPAMEWPWPIIVAAGTTFSAIVINNQAGTAIMNWNFTFHGVKAFKAGT